MKRHRFSDEVLVLIDSGQLHMFDAEWIVRLAKENQLAAALKCCQIDKSRMVTVTQNDNPRSCMGRVGTRSVPYGSGND